MTLDYKPVDLNYNHQNKSKFRLAELEGFVGTDAVLPLTGKIIGASESDAGAYIKFRVDDRFGLGTENGPYVIVIDADPLLIESSGS